MVHVKKVFKTTTTTKSTSTASMNRERCSRYNNEDVLFLTLIPEVSGLHSLVFVELHERNSLLGKAENRAGKTELWATETPGLGQPPPPMTHSRIPEA